MLFFQEQLAPFIKNLIFRYPPKELMDYKIYSILCNVVRLNK